MVDTIYTRLLAIGAEMDSHESDLYVKATPQVMDLVDDCSLNHSSFVSKLDGKWWIDIPFAYDPWWEKRPRRTCCNTKANSVEHTEGCVIKAKLRVQAAHNLMDPNETLKRLRELLGGEHDGPLLTRETAHIEAEELFQALDKWLSKGGLLPDKWMANHSDRTAVMDALRIIGRNKS